MSKYVIERKLPGAGKLSREQLQSISQKSFGVLQQMGLRIRSYVTDDELYCVYAAPNKEMIQQHTDEDGFPANRISEIKHVIDPVTAGA